MASNIGSNNERTNSNFTLFVRKKRLGKNLETFYGALSDLTRGWDFGDKKHFNLREVFILNMMNEKK